MTSRRDIYLKKLADARAAQIKTAELRKEAAIPLLGALLRVGVRAVPWLVRGGSKVVTKGVPWLLRTGVRGATTAAPWVARAGSVASKVSRGAGKLGWRISRIGQKTPIAQGYNPFGRFISGAVRDAVPFGNIGRDLTAMGRAIPKFRRLKGETAIDFVRRIAGMSFRGGLNALDTGYRAYNVVDALEGAADGDWKRFAAGLGRNALIGGMSRATQGMAARGAGKINNLAAGGLRLGAYMPEVFVGGGDDNTGAPNPYYPYPEYNPALNYNYNRY